MSANEGVREKDAGSLVISIWLSHDRGKAGSKNSQTGGSSLSEKSISFGKEGNLKFIHLS
jgi:hypothetical protein